VVLVGACFFAPLQEQLVQAALQQVQPDYIAVEQPADATRSASQPGVLLTHPLWIQTLLDNEDVLQPALRKGLARADSAGQQRLPTQQLQQLEQQLQDIGQPHARVGRDIMDPWESFGFYGALDLARSPSVVVPVLQRCGFLPGLELLAAVAYALEKGMLFFILNCCVLSCKLTVLLCLPCGNLWCMLALDVITCLLLPLLRGAGPMALMLWLDGMMTMMTMITCPAFP
jgi:hypothetical protein